MKLQLAFLFFILATYVTAQNELASNDASYSNNSKRIQGAGLYSVYVTGKAPLVKRLVDIINSELPSTSSVGSEPVDSTRNEYGLFFQGEYNQGVTTRQGRFSCAIHYLLRDSLKSFRLQLVENSKRILIADGQKAILDIADIEKFTTSEYPDFTASIVLLHELHEQHYVQKVKSYKPGKVNLRDLKVAHLRAAQKESAIYNLNMTKTTSAILSTYIDVEFQNRIDNSKDSYKAYYKRGNIERVVKSDNSSE